MDFVNGIDRDQLVMMDFEANVACDSWARIVDLFVEMLPLNELRQQITEHQFGTLKRQWGFTFTLIKGKENVLSEVNLMMMVYKLRRLISIYDINNLKPRLKSLVFQIMGIYSLYKAPLSTLYFQNAK